MLKSIEHKLPRQLRGWQGGIIFGLGCAVVAAALFDGVRANLNKAIDGVAKALPMNASNDQKKAS